MRRYDTDSMDAETLSGYCRTDLDPVVCEHCEGDPDRRSRFLRHDDLRGWVCVDCDSALDEMYASR